MSKILDEKGRVLRKQHQEEVTAMHPEHGEETPLPEWTEAPSEPQEDADTIDTITTATLFSEVPCCSQCEKQFPINQWIAASRCPIAEADGRKNATRDSSIVIGCNHTMKYVMQKRSAPKSLNNADNSRYSMRSTKTSCKT